MKEQGCLSPFPSSWVRTAPDAYLEASDSIWNGLVGFGIMSTGSSVKRFFSSRKAFSVSSVHSKGWSFLRRSFSAWVISAYHLMNFL
jgi:hypothetical protein